MIMSSQLDNLSVLTQAEFDIYLLLGQGKTNKQIADMPGQQRSIKTVSGHCGHIKLKLGLRSLMQVRLHSLGQQMMHDFSKLAYIRGRAGLFKRRVKFCD